VSFSFQNNSSQSDLFVSYSPVRGFGGCTPVLRHSYAPSRLFGGQEIDHRPHRAGPEESRYWETTGVEQNQVNTRDFDFITFYFLLLVTVTAMATYKPSRYLASSHPCLHLIRSVASVVVRLIFSMYFFYRRKMVPIQNLTLTHNLFRKNTEMMYHTVHFNLFIDSWTLQILQFAKNDFNPKTDVTTWFRKAKHREMICHTGTFQLFRMFVIFRSILPKNSLQKSKNHVFSIFRRFQQIRSNSSGSYTGGHPV
jgi:hypothetical protein